MERKLKYIANEIAKQNNDFACVEVIENSDFIFEKAVTRYTNNNYTLFLRVFPATYTKHFSEINRIRDLIQYYISSSSDYKITSISAHPDYDKISNINSEVSIIITEWDEINNLQQKLVENLNISNSSIDFQNVGNTSRTIMDKLARLVFNAELHKAPVNIDLSNGKFKNQLHTYISNVLSGSQNKELRLFATSAINFTENAIDLMNQTTHKLDVQGHFAEVCAISTISVISLIKAINEIQ